MKYKFGIFCIKYTHKRAREREIIGGVITDECLNGFCVSIRLLFYHRWAALLADDEVLATQKNYRQKKNLLLNRKLLNELWMGSWSELEAIN